MIMFFCRYDFVLIFDVINGNFNGDFDVGNLLCFDFEMNYGLVIDVSLKCKICNYVDFVCGGVDGYYIYV